MHSIALEGKQTNYPLHNIGGKTKVCDLFVNYNFRQIARVFTQKSIKIPILAFKNGFNV